MNGGGDTQRQRTVVVTRFSALGDVAMTIPVLYDICRANPGVRFVMVTKAATAPLYVNAPSNLTVDGVDLRGRFAGAQGLVKLFRYLRSTYGFDTLVDLHDVTRTKVLRLLARMSGMRVARIDKDRRGRRALIRRKEGEPVVQLESSFDRYRRAFARAGFSAPENFATLYDHIAPPEIDPAVAAPRREGERWIAVAPFAAHKGKVYPEELMTQVIRSLADSPRTRVFVFGAGAAESEAIERMAGGRPAVVSMASRRVGFAAELALLSRMDVALTMDSGNMHLASIAGTRVVSIWGQTSSECGFYGWRQHPSDALGARLECRPCSVFGNRQCPYGHWRCLHAVQPGDVVAHIDAVTGRIASSNPNRSDK